MKKFTLITLFLTAILSLGLFVNQLSAQTASFTTSEYTQASSDGTTYTWQVPPGVNTINIIAIGGGGGGGAVCPTFSSSAVRGCAGGGGGAYVRVNNYTVTPGDVLTIHVGSKGSGHQSCSSTYRGWGGDSWVKLGSTTIALAKGASDVADGAVNEPGTGGQASQCIGTEKFSGGNGGKGSTGAWCGSGGGGAAGGGNGGNGSEPTWTWVVIRHDHPGAAGTTSLPYAGNGAAGIVSHTGGTNGTNGGNYGGGGSGGSSGIGWGDANGGDGGPGYVLITYSAACDATPGSISPETWVCSSTDTAIVINSTAAATSTNPGSYMWKYSTDDANWSEISGATAATYTAHATGYYRRYYVVGTCEPVPTPSVYVTRPSGIDPGTIKDGDNETEKAICAGDAVNITLYKTYSDNVIWQTCPTNSTNNDDWTNVSTDNTYTITSVSATTYVRYIANYTATCGIPSNNVYVITVNQRPVVNSIANPTNLCPGESSYELIANITSSAAITTYTWTGATATGTGATAQVVPSSYQCGHTYNYSLKVKDANGCESEEVSGNFTTTPPTMTFGTVADVDAVTDGHCHFTVPTEAVLTAAVNNALTSSCNNAVTLSNITPAAGSSIDDDIASVTVRATATDRCGNTYPQLITINVVKPAAPEVTTLTAAAEYLCPGETTTLTATATGEDLTYQWNPSDLGTNATATTIAYTAEDVTVHADEYTVTVTDKYGCFATESFTVYTTPKAYIANKEYTICADHGATMSLVADDKVPAGTSTVGDFTFDYNTTYTWTITTPNTNITGATEATTAQENFTTGDLGNATLVTQTIVYTVTPTTTTTVDGEVTSCVGASFTVTVKVRPKVTNDGAITNFDDDDVIITLWYSACDTLYYVETPTYDNNILPADLFVTISNSASSSANAGTILGRIAPGEYTIVWTLTDMCGNYVTYTKKYIVRYPNCGDNDPNYTEPYTVTYDGYTYSTVRIGCECWTAENLRSTKYSDDTDIPSSNVYHSDDYPNDAENEAKFGRLYSWYSAMHVTEGDDTAEPATSNSPVGRYVQGVCPAGWAVPTVGIYTSMKNISGAIENVKSSDQTTWLPGLAGIAPGSGFNAKGAGYYESYIDRYMNLLGQTDFWTSTIGPTVQKGTCVEITHVCPEMLIKDYMKGLGFSVRCVKRDYAPEPETFNCGTSKMIDAGGHEYETVQIGTQCWTKTNLHVAPAGAMDKTASSSIETSSTEPYYYVYPYVDASVYGYYYNWQAARLVCPTGWHLPSDAEWTTLTDYVGSQSEYVCGSPADPTYIAKALASKEDWESSTGSCTPGYNTNTNNNTGFSAIPADIYNGTAVARPALGYYTYFWSSTEDGSNTAFDRRLSYGQRYVNRFGESKENSMSVRCVKDSE
ncbi:MAG: fibrobacter succinogenes major paralogous domain-containing protein [Bacteroidales bacterium]|nr:fibrobacter succinogenes major paralogous domain-containing protein [Bacteroidales bacterium]